MALCRQPAPRCQGYEALNCILSTCCIENHLLFIDNFECLTVLLHKALFLQELHDTLFPKLTFLQCYNLCRSWQTLGEDNYFSFPQGGMVPFAERQHYSVPWGHLIFFQIYWPLSWIGLNRFKISKISLTRFILTNSSKSEFNELKKSFLLLCWNEEKLSVLAATQKQALIKYS